jgi:hypothetical protein
VFGTSNCPSSIWCYFNYWDSKANVTLRSLALKLPTRAPPLSITGIPLISRSMSLFRASANNLSSVQTLQLCADVDVKRTCTDQLPIEGLNVFTGLVDRMLFAELRNSSIHKVWEHGCILTSRGFSMVFTMPHSQSSTAGPGRSAKSCSPLCHLK